MSVVEAARKRANDALFERVAGPQGHAARERIHRTPGPRWFQPGSPIRRVHGDASMYIGGVRALLLQSLHPLAMAAVADHSGFRGDPWGRLARTSTFVAETTFATEWDAARAVAVVRSVHERVTGATPDGRPYRADDPHLLTWVHIAEIDSFLRAHQRYGSDPLSGPEADEYVAQASSVARRLGATDVPTTRRELAAVIEGYRDELEGTTAAVEAARFLLLKPPVPAVVRVPYGLLTAAAVGLLPPWARAPLRLPRLPIAEATVVRVGGHAMVGGLRWLAGARPVPFIDDEEPAVADHGRVSTMSVTAFKDLPIADRDREWDGAAAEKRVRAWAGAQDEPNQTYRDAHIWYDREKKDNFTAYKLLVADVVEGRLVAVPRGVMAAAAVMQGSRGGIDLPRADIDRVKSHLAKYYKKMDDEPPWKTD